MSVSQAAQVRTALPNIWHRTLPKIWVDFLYVAYRPREWFWIHSKRKMETIHPVDGSFASEFPAICNHCVVMAAWSRKTLNVYEKILRFWEKTTPYAKIFKILFQKFSPLHRSPIVVFKCEIWPTENLRNRALFTWQKISQASQTVATARIPPKTCQDQPPTMYSEYARFHPNRFTFGGVIATAK